jgi:hypothetical protein
MTYTASSTSERAGAPASGADTEGDIVRGWGKWQSFRRVVLLGWVGVREIGKEE